MAGEQHAKLVAEKDRLVVEVKVKKIAI